MDEQALRQMGQEILTDINEWRRAHPGATYVEIEDKIHKRMVQLEARLIEGVIEGSPSLIWERGSKADKGIKEISIDKNYLQAMWHEACARDGFLIQLRTDLKWDKEAFDRLTESMRLCCKHYEVVSAHQLKHIHEQAATAGKEWALRFQSQKDEDAFEEDLTDPPLPETKRLLPDWLAEQFWYIPQYVIDWTSHQVWEKDRAREPDYFEKAYSRLMLLASWFFSGRCPWLDEEKGWASTFVREESI